jgi:hypothetical protein
MSSPQSKDLVTCETKGTPAGGQSVPDGAPNYYTEIQIQSQAGK